MFKHMGGCADAAWMHCGSIMEAVWILHGCTVDATWMHCGCIIEAMWMPNGCTVQAAWKLFGRLMEGQGWDMEWKCNGYGGGMERYGLDMEGVLR